MSIDAFRETIDRIRATPDLKERCKIAGRARQPTEEDDLTKAGDNCIYFLAHRGWCDLPELNVPVDPDWYCVLWWV